MPQTPSPKDKLHAVRATMKTHQVDAFIVPRADEYQGEFVAAYADRLKWLSDFTGSGGCGLVTAEKAVVLTDGRYLIQVDDEVDLDHFETADSTKLSIGEWFARNLSAGVIGYDPMLHTPGQIEALLKDLADKDVQLKAVPNLIDVAWQDQPSLPAGAVELFPEALAGQSRAAKVAGLTEKLKENDLNAYIITLPDSIAWLLNVRGCDINYIPQVLSYLLVSADGTLTWFIDPQKLSTDVIDAVGAQIVSPSDIEDHFQSLSDRTVGIDFKAAPVWFKATLEVVGAHVSDLKDPCAAPKALKNAAEQEAIKQAHIVDGVALVNFLYWIDQNASTGTLTELDVADTLEQCRAVSPTYRGASFPTIAGYGAHGAIVHYRPTQRTNATITAPGLLLVDSGGQYLQGGGGQSFAGTTDLTRTVAIGQISDEMKDHFTLVLKGHIAVAQARFKPGTLGKEIDALARAALKDAGLDYAHGTGHGVGCYLAVHEDAAHISPKGERALEPGMLLSNEPGYYQEGSHGIRTENLIFVQAQGDELFFETISFAPIDVDAINVSLLTQEEKDWLNTYHAAVDERLSVHLDEDARVWLKHKTQAIS